MHLSRSEQQNNSNELQKAFSAPAHQLHRGATYESFSLLQHSLWKSIGYRLGYFDSDPTALVTADIADDMRRLLPLTGAPSTLSPGLVSSEAIVVFQSCLLPTQRMLVAARGQDRLLDTLLFLRGDSNVPGDAAHDARVVLNYLDTVTGSLRRAHALSSKVERSFVAPSCSAAYRHQLDGSNQEVRGRFVQMIDNALSVILSVAVIDIDAHVRRDQRAAHVAALNIATERWRERSAESMKQFTAVTSGA